jgi:hypothetical protein
LKSRNTAHEEYRLAIEDPLKTVEDRFKRLELDGQPVEVSDYAREEDVQILVDALTAFELGYDLSIRSKTQLSKVPHIKAFLESPDHCRITPFTLEYRICGKTGCTICAKIGRGVRTPDVEVGDYNLGTEVLRYMDLPVPNPINLIHYLSPLAARASNDKKSLDSLLRYLPTTKGDTEEKKSIPLSKEHDKGKAIAATKVRSVAAKCDDCGASRCIYSTHALDAQKGSTKKEL